MEEKEYSVSFGQLIRIALKQWWIIAASTVFVAAIAFIYVNYFVTPKYTSYAKVGMSLNSESVSAAYQNAALGTSLAKEGADILSSNITLDRAAEKLNDYFSTQPGGNPFRSSDYKWQDIQSMLKTSTADDTRYFEVKITSTNPKEAAIVAQCVIEAYCEVLKDKDRTGDIIDTPVEPSAPSSPNKALTVILGALAGALLSFGILLVIYFSKDAIDGEDWLIDTYRENMPMLAVIPDANGSRSGKKYGYKYGYRYGYK